VELELDTPAGRRRFESHLYPERDAGGAIGSLIGITADWPQNRRTDVFRTMADAAPVLVWMADSTKACTWFNRCWLEFTGRTLQQELGYGWTEGVHPEDLARCVEVHNSSFDARRPFSIEFRLRRYDGEYRWVLNNGTPLFDGPGSPFTGYIGSCTDITETKNALADRERLLEAERLARAQAEVASRIKDEFLATLSHELRTPLNAVLGWSEVLRRRGPLPPDMDKGLETISRNARAQAQIITDLLDMSRIMSGKVRLDIQDVDLHEIIEAAVEAVRPVAQEKGLRLQTALDGRIFGVKGDPARLQQALGNLLTNAVKFTPSGGRINVTLERVNSHVEVSVTDTGAGIPAEFLPYVFDRFRQADASTTRRHGGLGLGLSIVRSLIEMHGGAVRVKSPGKGLGSTFIVALPVAAVSDTSRRKPPPLLSGQDLVELPRLDEVSALVVDDEADARALVARIVEERGARVVAVSSAQQALDAIARERFHILISDIGMADMDGYDLIRAVRLLPPEQSGRVPAIAVTAFARGEDRQRSLLAGYQMHISKPLEPRELVAAVSSLIGVAPQSRNPDEEPTG
jgi:PAS domain S-box-containing protein